MIYGVKSVIALTNELKQADEIKCAKVLQDGPLMVICNSEEQRNRAIKMKIVCKQ